MTAVIDDFWDTEGDVPTTGRGGVARDYSGRALLKPRGLGVADVRVPYSSASGLADHISDPEHFHTWDMRMLAKGMGLRPDLGRLAVAEPYSTSLYPPDFKRGEKAASGRALDRIVERAMDAIVQHEKADYGTAFHAHTEPGAPKPSPMDEELTRDVDSFWDCMRRECVTLVDTERFTANDATMSAGTYDHGVRVLGHPLLEGYVIGDKKTGKSDPLHWAVQIASYANGEFYDRETDERTPFPDDINLDWGVVFWTPALSGRTQMVLVDLRIGWELALAAAAARDGKANKAIVGTYRSATFTQRLNAVATRDDAVALWHSTTDVAERALITEKMETL